MTSLGKTFLALDPATGEIDTIMIRAVVDTNVLVAGLRSITGASHELLARLRARRLGAGPQQHGARRVP